MGRSRTSSASELLVPLQRDGTVPLHGQLEQELRRAIRGGRLAAGAVLPSSRALAAQLGLSRGVVVEAYEQLVAEGYLTSQPGGATRVAAVNAGPAPVATSRTDMSAYRINFGYGRPDVTQFPRQVWLRSLRRVLNEAPSERLSYLDHRGAPELREALAAYLNRVRGTAADPERMVVCSGFAQGFALIARALKARGGTTIAMEDPGQTEARDTAAVFGLRALPVPVDASGIVVEALARTGTDAVLVTPAHQFPLGAVLSAERRAELVRWATEGDRLVIEDDYDAEYRYDREPIGSIQGLAPEHVIYAGTASKTLAPGLRLGWLVVPSQLVAELAEIKEATDRGTPSLEQLAFADFLVRGEFDHHLRRMRPVYRARRDFLLHALRRHLPELGPMGASAGLHVTAWLPADISEARLIERVAARCVGVYGLAPYHATPGPETEGLVFGYGTVSEAEIDEGIQVVADELAGVREERRDPRSRSTAT
jgi:GntR family transcriptional regulator/MocR family aminotransferase